jgi:hypothetical protein
MAPSATDGRMATFDTSLFFGSSRTNSPSATLHAHIRILTSEQNCSLQQDKVSDRFWTANWRLVALLSGAMTRSPEKPADVLCCASQLIIRERALRVSLFALTIPICVKEFH